MNLIEIMNDILSKERKLDVYSSLEGDISELPCIFIIGLPRSGTTFLSQILSCYCELGYIDNIIARFWKCPALGIALSQEILGSNRHTEINFTSDLGRTEGAAGPHEFGYFWTHWFGFRDDLSHCLNSSQKSLVDKKGLFETLCLITIFWNKAVLFKNLTCGLQADFLSEMYPKSFFIYLDRNLYDTGGSILLARKQYMGSVLKWWALRPSTWPFSEEIQKNPAMSVAKQMIDCKSDIERALAKVSSDRIQRITYEELIEDPKKIIDEICDAIKNAFGYSIAVGNYTPPPIIKEEGISEISKDLLKNLELSLDELMP